MGARKGAPGHRRGKPNKKKEAFRAALRKYMGAKKVDPHHYMVDLLADQDVEDLSLKFQAAKELAQYLEPKLRSVEVTGDEDNPLSVRLEDAAKLSDAQILTLLGMLKQ